MKVAQLKSILLPIFTVLLLTVNVPAEVQTKFAHTNASQSAVNSLTSLPEADVVLFISPQKILSEAAPKVMTADELAKMKASFVDLKRSIGIEPSSIDYLIVAVRFHKPTAELSFVAPDVITILSGDFSADSLMTLAGLYLQDKAHSETYQSKTMTIMKIDDIAQAAEKNPLLKSFVELGAVPLNANTIAIGNVDYLKAAIDAEAGTGRINPEIVSSLLRDSNALMSAAGSPLSAFAKGFGLLGTQTTPREIRCDTKFGDFYAAITMDETNFSLRGAMNVDNPDTAKIINGLVSVLIEPALESAAGEKANPFLKQLQVSPKESEIVFSADIPQQTVGNFIREQINPKPDATTVTGGQAKPKPKARTRTRRRVPRK